MDNATRWIGIDLHRRRSQIAVIDEHGELALSRRIVNDRETFLELLGDPESAHVVLEATYAEDSEAAEAQGHMSATQAGQLARRADVTRLVLTHLIPGEQERVAALAAREFDGTIELAREGLSIDLA